MDVAISLYHPPSSETFQYQTAPFVEDKELGEIVNYNFPKVLEKTIIKKENSGLPFTVAFNPALDSIYVIQNTPLEKNETSTIKLCFNTKAPRTSLVYKCYKDSFNETERKINCLLSAYKNLFVATDEIYNDTKDQTDSITVVKSGMILEHMEWSLKALLEKKNLSIKSRVSILIDVLTALITLHDQGIAHLDLNWNNILLNVEALPGSKGRKYHTKIADFGTSEFLGNAIGYGKTSFFVAPEIRERKENESNDLKTKSQNPPRAKSSIDMWNFGVVALLLIGKKDSWEAWKKISVKNELLSTFSLRISEVYKCLLNESIGSNLCTIPIRTAVINVIDRCLKLDPEKRITAIKAKEELEKAKEMLSNFY